MLLGALVIGAILYATSKKKKDPEESDSLPPTEEKEMKSLIRLEIVN